MSYQFPIRGIMLDMARLTERMDYYRKVIDHAARWGVNTILLHLTDDQGCALRFDSHPAFASRFAFDKDQMRKLVAYADRRDVTLIPEIESFGHTKYITLAQGYTHLADASEDHRNAFNAICPVHRQTLKVFRDLYQETAEVFASSPYIHIGCDEVNFGFSAASRKVLDHEPKFAVFGRYVSELVGLVRRCGKQPIMWADHAVHDPRILDFIDRDVIMHDWGYDKPLPHPHIRLLSEKGYKLIAGPALMWYKYRLRTPVEAWDVLDDFLNRLNEVPASQALGVINTIWVPSRYPCGALWPAIGVFAGRMRGESYRKAREKFLDDFWDLDQNNLISALDRSFQELLPYFNQPQLFWANPSALADMVQGFPSLANFEKTSENLVREFECCRKKVQRNKKEFDSFLLSLKAQYHGLWRTKRVIEALASSEKTAMRILSKLASTDDAVAREMEKDWNLTRFADDPRKSAAEPTMKEHDLLVVMVRSAADFTRRLPGIWTKLHSQLMNGNREMENQLLR